MKDNKHKMNRNGNPGPRPKQAFDSGYNYKGEVKSCAKELGGGMVADDTLNYNKAAGKVKGGSKKGMDY